ncbi:unnamed protein product [Oppiella nova]|uniref:Uncharacterized protein n=1 Tax=Oppiella nova TaxID=334625 RepID=A0A7R9QTB0_9ACAR|nr:unnamed protein product [Oppiella nova]CAG2173219.1 unnamed protein product [Oppiella nova]
MLWFSMSEFLSVFLCLRRRYSSDKRVDGQVVVITVVSAKKPHFNTLQLDLCSLQSVRHFAKELSQLESKVDILINNAGVMICPEWQTTDGFEMQFGTNHLEIQMSEFLSVFLCLRRRYSSDKRVDGQVVVITGGNSGIGKETAFQLTLRGAKVYIGCRDMRKGDMAVHDIQAMNPKADITALQLDLCSLQSVRHFAKELSQLESKVDILINNAGVMICPEWQTTDGFEMQFGTNHLGHFLLTLHLIPLMKSPTKARIINLSSVFHTIGEINFQNINLRNGAYNPYQAYANSKLCNVIFTKQLATRLQGTGITAYCLHPGVVKTQLFQHKLWAQFLIHLLFMSPEMGCQTTLYCALDDQLANESGFYYDNCRRVSPNRMVRRATDDSIGRQLWELSADLVALETRLNI